MSTAMAKHVKWKRSTASFNTAATAMAKHVKWKRSTASFNTAAGQYETKHTAKVLFTLLEF
jgi:hypothetical protein